MNRIVLLFLAALLAACGPNKPRPTEDAGMETDAGVDAGVDAGRMKGIDPPSGYTTALALPTTGGPAVRMGVSAVMVLDQFGHPIVAGIHTDPNNDLARIDDKLIFTRWNGLEKMADGGTVGYQPPVEIAQVGEINLDEPNRQVSLTRDAITGTLGLAYVTDQKVIKLALSDDEGVNWSRETASSASTHILSNPVVVLNNNVTHLAYFETEVPCGTPDCGRLIYRRRVGKGAFTDAISPVPAATDVTLAKPIALAVDSAGNAGVAYFTGPGGAASGPVSLLFWRPSGSTTQKIADSGAAAIPRPPSVSLGFSGANPRAAYHLPSSISTEAQLWYAAAADAAGSAFTAVAIPRNMGEGTQSYQALAFDSAGKIAVAANYAQSPFSQQCTGGPKVSRSSDGTTFTTCRADTGSTPVFGFAGLWINAAFHKADKLTLAFTYETNSNPSVNGGLIVFRQP